MMVEAQPISSRITVLPLDHRHVPAVAHLHATALRGDFLPSLGESFLRVFYQTVLTCRAGFGFVVLGLEGVEGFVLGSDDSSNLFKQVLARSFLALGWAALPAILRRPALIGKALETFLYPAKEHVPGVKAELVVIAVQEGRRGLGLGQTLVASLIDDFEGRGIQQFKVTVLKANSTANRFYRSLKFTLQAEFALYGRAWNLYLRSPGGQEP